MGDRDAATRFRPTLRVGTTVEIGMAYRDGEECPDEWTGCIGTVEQAPRGRDDVLVSAKVGGTWKGDVWVQRSRLTEVRVIPSGPADDTTADYEEEIRPAREAYRTETWDPAA